MKNTNLKTFKFRNIFLVIALFAILINATGLKSVIKITDPFNRIVPDFSFSDNFVDNDAADVSDLLNNMEKELAVINESNDSSNKETLQDISDAIRSVDDIMETVSDNFEALTDVYNEHESNSNGIFGNRMKVEFGLSMAGKVKWAKVVESNINSIIFTKEILKELKTWEFKSCTDCSQAIVTLPINFSSISSSSL